MLLCYTTLTSTQPQTAPGAFTGPRDLLGPILVCFVSSLLCCCYPSAQEGWIFCFWQIFLLSSSSSSSLEYQQGSSINNSPLERFLPDVRRRIVLPWSCELSNHQLSHARQSPFGPFSTLSVPSKKNDRLQTLRWNPVEKCSLDRSK